MTLWTVALQAPLFTGFSRHEYWSKLPFPSPGDLPDPEIELVSLASPALQAGSLPTEPSGKPCISSLQKRMRVCLEPSEMDLGRLASNTVREYICAVLSHPGCLQQPEETKTSYMTSRKIERDQGAHVSHPRNPDLASCWVASSWSPNPGQVPKREGALGLSRALGKAEVLHQLQEGCSPTLSLQHTGHFMTVLYPLMCLPGHRVETV